MLMRQISTLVLLGCLFPAVLSRPSVSLQNDGYGNYNFEYDVSHPKGSSRGHMTFGSTSKKHTGSHTPDQYAQKNQNQADAYAAHSPLSSPHNPDSYRVEKEARGPQHYSNTPYETEVLHEPRPIYPSPYDSTEKQLGNHNGAHDEAYNPPLSKVNYQPPTHSASGPEADYYPQPIHDGPGHVVEPHGHPGSYTGHGPVVAQEPVAQEPVAQDSVPAFNDQHQGYASNHDDTSDLQPVPVGPNYQFIPSGPPYVVDSHTTEIIHPPLPQDPVVQQAVEVSPHPQEAIPYVPQNEGIKQQPTLSHAFQLPIAHLPVQTPILSAPEAEDIHQATHEDDIVPPPSNPILVQEQSDLPLYPNQHISQDLDLPSPSEGVHPPPVSHAFRLPLLPIASEHSPIPSGPSADAVHSVAHLEHSAGIAPIDPISHSTRLLIPGPVGHEASGAPSVSPYLLPPLGPDSSDLGPHGIDNEPINSVSGFSGIDSSVDGHVIPPISHAFRLSLPLAAAHKPAPIDELRTVEGPSPFTEVETPEVPQLPQLSHAFRLNIPNLPKIE